jgi:hypothetical protein
MAWVSHSTSATCRAREEGGLFVFIHPRAAEEGRVLGGIGHVRHVPSMATTRLLSITPRLSPFDQRSCHLCGQRLERLRSESRQGLGQGERFLAGSDVGLTQASYHREHVVKLHRCVLTERYCS